MANKNENIKKDKKEKIVVAGSILLLSAGTIALAYATLGSNLKNKFKEVDNTLYGAYKIDNNDTINIQNITYLYSVPSNEIEDENSIDDEEKNEHDINESKDNN